MELKGKSVVKVGGLGGIGYATSKVLLTKKISKLAILDVKNEPQSIMQLLNDPPNSKVVFHKMDITKKSEIVEYFNKIWADFGGFDILINCGGVLMDDDPRATIEINLLGVINTCLVAHDYMNKDNGGPGGLIVNVSSVAGLEVEPSFAIYTASKHGVIGFTRSLSDEFYFNKIGVGLIAICPGKTSTSLIVKADDHLTFPYSEAIGDKYSTYKGQTSDECAVNLVQAIEFNKNGSIWICDLGKLNEVILTNLDANCIELTDGKAI